MPNDAYNRAATTDLPYVLWAARKLVRTAQRAHSSGTLNQGLLDCIEDVRNDMGQLLAYFEDGDGYGRTTYGAINRMRSIEQIADDLVLHGPTI